MTRESTPRVSVVLPVRNVGPYVARAVSSILDQTFRDFEVIVVDDGSTDDTAAEVLRVADERVHLIENPRPTGDLGETLNLGLAAARGELIARMDGDDLSYPGRLEAQVKAFDADPHLALVGCWSDMIDEDGNDLMVSRPPHTDSTIRFVLHYQNTFHHPSVMFRAALAEKVGRYGSGKSFAEDYELWARLAQAGRVANIPEVLGAQRIRASSVSALYPAGQTAIADEVGTAMFTASVGRAPSLPTLHRLRDGRGPDSTSAEAARFLHELHSALRQGLREAEAAELEELVWVALCRVWLDSRGAARLRPWITASRLRPYRTVRRTARALVIRRD